MQTLFGDQSDYEEEEEVDSNQGSTCQPDYFSEEREGGIEYESEVDIKGKGKLTVESEAELHDIDPGPGASEDDTNQSSIEGEVRKRKATSEVKEAESDEQEEYDQRVRIRRRREVIDNDSERSEKRHYTDNEDDEVDQSRGPSMSPSEEKDQTHISHSVAEIRDVFGDSEEDELEEYAAQNDLGQESHRSPKEEGSDERNLRAENIVLDEYESDENYEQKPKEKPVGPPLEIKIPLYTPPGRPDKMNMIKISNIMGIEPKPFDPKNYEEENMFVTDESGSKKRIRLENNVVRWRRVQNPDGTMSVESNARFVRWSDGSLQLLIGNEVLEISVQEAHHDQAHLFLRHGKGVLQSQGRLLRKMRFMPSSLSSNSHRLLTALVDSRHKKVYKVKNCITDIDPEREKEEKEKAEIQTIRANELLNRKREKVNRKYTQRIEKVYNPSSGSLEEALDEDAEPHYNESGHMVPHQRFENDLEAEAQAEKHLINAKKLQVQKDIPQKSSLSAIHSSRYPVEFSDSDREESQYESDKHDDEMSPMHSSAEEAEHGDDEQSEGEAGAANEAWEDEVEDPEPELRDNYLRSKGSLKHKELKSDDGSPPRKTSHRRKAIVYESDEE